MSQYLTFRKLESLEEAQAIQQLLDTHNIPSQLEINKALLDTNLIGQQFDPAYWVKIPSGAFKTAETLVRESIDVKLHEVEENYYLLSFSDEELMEVIEKKDEWGNYDYALALHLLKTRGIELTDADLERIDQQRIRSLAKPDNGNNLWIFIGYLSAAFLGALGLFIGFFMLRTKKTLPDGSRAYAFSDRARRHGKYILFTGCAAVLLWLVPSLFLGIATPVYALLFGVLSLTSAHF
ncbi:hypothetical protein F0L74_00860 [Chitinophaga agrisoli]|uniref:Signal transducing protein n=1 Tax=Chitinophaga agrisoli TaxID=2607653 RepID=A0A5B2W0U1_9BACT|nr:hypothetical protein [Chitinophaga agrisoli]KAA2244558.1 hypothetical protein F0L74_00860 [Chitinophaga agrisoli]